ncbi:MAG: autotransporter domain-containing protein [Phycisphaeraceae bacterium]
MARLQTPLTLTKLLAIGLAGCLTAGPALAADVTWDGGGGDGEWSNDDNWDTGVAPVAGDALFFDGEEQTSTTNDLAADTAFQDLTFNADASAFTLSGAAIGVQADGAIRNLSDQQQTIELAIEALGNLTIDADAGALALSGDLNLADASATLTLTGTSQLVLAGDLTGDADLLKTGENDAALTGDASGFTGTTRIEEGSLALAGPVGGDVELVDGDLQLWVDNAIPDDHTLTITGGTLTVADGSRTLENTVELAGDVTVAGGQFRTLELLAPLEVQGSHALEVASQTRLLMETLDSDVAGHTLTKAGDGRLEITGDSTAFAGQINVDAGDLFLTGELDADVAVNDAASLFGDGTISGDVQINSGGQHGPGQSIGTQRVVGDYTLATGGQLTLEFDAGGDSDLVDVDGTATLEDGSTLQLVQTGQGLVTEGDTLTVISTTGGVTDEGANVASPSAFLVWSGDVVGSDYVLSVAVGSVFQDVAEGRNNVAVARALDRMAAGAVSFEQDLVLGELQTLGAGAFNETLRRLSPEQVQALPNTGIEVAHSMHGTFNARMARQRLGVATAPAAPGPAGLTLASAELSPAVLAQVLGAMQDPYVHPRLRQQQEQRRRQQQRGGRSHQPEPSVSPRLQRRDYAVDWNVDVQGIGILQRQDRTDDQPGYRGDTGGFVLSADRAVHPEWRVGMSFSYAYTRLVFRDDGGDGNIHHLRGGPYASFARDPWFVDASLTAGYHRNKLERGVQVGVFDLTAESRFDSYDVAAYVGGGYDYELNRRTTVTPLASLEYLHYRQRGFTEEGAGPVNLDVDSSNTDALRSTLGIRLMHVMPLGDTVLVPEASLGWRHEFLHDEQRTTARFVDTVTPFTIRSDGGSRDTAVLGAGATALVNEAVSLYGNYQAELGSDDDTHLFRFGAQLRY